MEFDELNVFLGDRLTTSKAIRLEHSQDESWHLPKNIPDAITYPETSEEVSKIIKFASKNNIPVIPFGTGTALEGHIHALKGGITINSSKMNKIIELNLSLIHI